MLVFDIETNGLYADVSKLFCMSVYDTDTKEMKQYDEEHAEEGARVLYDAWKKGAVLCGHNVINYDIPTLAKLYPSWFVVEQPLKKRVVDTLVLSRLIYSHIEDTDAGLLRSKKLPSKLYKSHSLKAWGYRLGVLKGNYGENEDAWAAYNPEMLAYNKQDVVVTVKLLEKLLSKNYSQKAIDLEHDVAWLMSKQEKNGFPFDQEKALKLEAELRARAGVLTAQLIQMVPRVPDKIFVPKRDNKRLGYKAGVPVQKYKDFNPNSRQQIEWLLRTHYHYSPNNPDCYDIQDDTDTDDFSKYRLKIDDETMKFMKEDTEAPEEVKKVVAILEESLMLKKRLGQLADGNNAWLSMVGKDGNIHGSVIPNGAVSGRATHSRPNIAQVPHVGSPYGKECRELFTVPQGWWQAGIDACGLELRCLAHFMYKYDGGQYAHAILNGDIHTMNQKAAGLPTRNQAKTFIYAFLM